MNHLRAIPALLCPTAYLLRDAFFGGKRRQLCAFRVQLHWNCFSRFCAATIRRSLVVIMLFQAGWTFAQTQPSRVPGNRPQPGITSPALDDDRTLNETRQELLRLLKMTPTLTTVVAHDPSLLSDQQYVARNNPALAQFLESHPEVVHNADFYLFADLGRDERDRVRGLERKVWPELQLRQPEPDQDPGPFIVGGVISIIAIALFWLLKLLVEHSRWKRAFKGQTDMQNKLLDKFTGNEGLIAYLETDAGKQLLQMPSIPAIGGDGARPKGMLDRMLMPLQLGVVLISVGIGLQLLRNSFANSHGLLAISTLVLTLGIGLAAASLVSWLIARYYGLLPRFAEDDSGQGPRE